MAFSFFLSLFPSLIVLFSLIPYFPIFENFHDTLYSEIKRIMPNEAGEAFFARVEEIATRQRGGLLSLSFFLTILFSSNGMLAMMRGFEKSYRKTFIKRKVWHKQLIAIELTALLGALLMAYAGLIIIGNYIRKVLLTYIEAGPVAKVAFSMFQWFSVLILIYMGTATLYKFGIATRRKLRFFSPGASLSTVLSILASLGFSFYVDNFGRYNELYGPIGAIIVLMLWIQINCFSLQIGFELNASIAVNRDLRYSVEDQSNGEQDD